MARTRQELHISYQCLLAGQRRALCGADATTPVSGRTYAFTYEPIEGVRAAVDYSSLYNLAIVVNGRIPEQLTFRGARA